MSGARVAARPVLLIVEDDAGLQRQLRWAYDGYEVVVAGDRVAALEAVRLHEPQVVTLDLGLPPDPDGTSEGLAALGEILSLKPDTKVIVASGHGARPSALAAIAGGAWDFYQKPIDIDQLGLIVARAFHVQALEAENRRLAQRVEGSAGLGGLITAAPEMLKVMRTIERIAPADISVMLLGASGTGKELLARGLHDASSRRDRLTHNSGILMSLEFVPVSLDEFKVPCGAQFVWGDAVKNDHIQAGPAVVGEDLNWNDVFDSVKL